MRVGPIVSACRKSQARMPFAGAVRNWVQVAPTFFPAAPGIQQGASWRTMPRITRDRRLPRGRQSWRLPKTVDLYIELTNSVEAFTDSEFLIEPAHEDVGPSPSKVCSTQRTLSGV
jgi:hypothetical protein